MKIIFFCGSLQPGHDGVGDYTRRLCGAVVKAGCQAQIMSLCDNQRTTFSTEKQEVDEAEVLVHRIPVSTSNKQRFIWTQEILGKFQPDWISMQFVPYSYNVKGLPFWLPSFIKKLKGNHKLHIMFHELWIGMDDNPTFKSKLIGFLQKKIVLKIIKAKSKTIINTQTDLYQFKINALGYNAEILPLFSNITKNSQLQVKSMPSEFELNFCIFGNIHYGAPVEKFIEDLQQFLLASNDKRVLKFTFIGNSGVAIEEWKKVLLAKNINFESTGFATDKKIGVFFSNCHYGISTTPYILNQKSGSLMAMFDYHLPVLCVARNWTVEGFNQRIFLNLVNYENKEIINEFINRKFIVSEEHNLNFVALKFLKGLK